MLREYLVEAACNLRPAQNDWNKIEAQASIQTTMVLLC